MTRLTPLSRDELDDAGRALWDTLVDTRSGSMEMIDSDGALIGPFNAFVHAPELGKRLSSLGVHLRFGVSLDRRLIELAICTVGAYWHAEFEFWAHARMAIEHGVTPDVVEMLRSGDRPDFELEDERVVYELVTQSLVDHRVSDEVYAEARELLGEPALVELISVAGYYCLASLLLNVFDVALPDGVERSWPDLA